MCITGNAELEEVQVRLQLFGGRIYESFTNFAAKLKIASSGQLSRERITRSFQVTWLDLLEVTGSNL